MSARLAAAAFSLVCMLSSVAQAAPVIAPFEADSLEKIVSAHKGRPFLLMVWSLDCVFCKASMAELARHQRKGPRLADGKHMGDLIDLEKREVAMRVYSDPEIYQYELERIFNRSWLKVGHVSEIPNPGDYMLSYMGEDSVIVIRGRDDHGHDARAGRGGVAHLEGPGHPEDIRGARAAAAARLGQARAR